MAFPCSFVVQQRQRTLPQGRQSAGKLMPAWKGQLSDEKIWQITAFIHSLREPAP